VRLFLFSISFQDNEVAPVTFPKWPILSLSLCLSLLGYVLFGLF
jgi:hypothetical protein